jgi:hypothetical protein
VVGRARGTQDRGEALAGLFLISYVGLSLPALGIGIATRYVTPATAMTWLSIVLFAILGTVATLSTRRTPRQR